MPALSLAEQKATLERIKTRADQDFGALMAKHMDAANAVEPGASFAVAILIAGKSLATLHAHVATVTGIPMKPTPPQITTAAVFLASWLTRDQAQPFDIVQAWLFASTIVEMVGSSRIQ